MTPAHRVVVPWLASVAMNAEGNSSRLALLRSLRDRQTYPLLAKTAIGRKLDGTP